MKSILFIVALSTLAACSNRQVYDSLQGARRDDCSRIADSSERERCFSEAGKSYDRYQKERTQ